VTAQYPAAAVGGRIDQDRRIADVEVAVIGGGQAGLAAGYFLRRAKADFVVLDAQSRPGGAWRHGWDSLRLFSPARYSPPRGRQGPRLRRTGPEKAERPKAESSPTPPKALSGHSVGEFGADGQTRRSAKQFARGRRGGILTTASRSDTAAIMPDRWRPLITAGHRRWTGAGGRGRILVGFMELREGLGAGRRPACSAGDRASDSDVGR
jgi:hypothetical protein